MDLGGWRDWWWVRAVRGIALGHRLAGLLNSLPLGSARHSLLLPSVSSGTLFQLSFVKSFHCARHGEGTGLCRHKVKFVESLPSRSLQSSDSVDC